MGKKAKYEGVVKADFPGDSLGEVTDSVEESVVRWALEQCEGNQTHAAKLIGISRRAMTYKALKYGLRCKDMWEQ